MTNQEKSIIEAVKAAKRSQFGLTGVKVELEIVFQRHLAPSPSYGCKDCEEGEMACSNCESEGCDDCDDTGYRMCVPCIEKNTDFNNLISVHDTVLKQLVPFGLAERIPKDEHYQNGYLYRPTGALVYSKVYHDLTVDTEMTFTIAVKNEKDVLKLPEVLKAFYSLKDIIKQTPSVANAGMHMALLNSPTVHYPEQIISDMDYQRFKNFKKSMILLMPALYFLGASSERTRPLGFRRPMVDQQHYAAINWSGGALEFRVFDTCYDQPEMILDNLMVMLNCLRFWTRKYTRNHLQKITKECLFGKEGSDDLKRLYVTSQHIDLLNRGLRMIKPSYRTITELKTQRKFTLNKRELRDTAKVARVEAERQYIEYEKRFGWEQVMRRQNYIHQWLQDNLIYPGNTTTLPEPNDNSFVTKAETYADERMKSRTSDKQPKEDFCESTVNKLLKAGDFRLCVE